MLSIYFLLGNAVVKTTFLIILFLIAFRRLLTEPLTDLTEQIESFELNDDIDGQRIDIGTTERNELKIMEEAFNKLIDKVGDYRNQLDETQKELLISKQTNIKYA